MLVRTLYKGFIAIIIDMPECYFLPPLESMHMKRHESGDISANGVERGPRCKCHTDLVERVYSSSVTVRLLPSSSPPNCYLFLSSYPCPSSLAVHDVHDIYTTMILMPVYVASSN